MITLSKDLAKMHFLVIIWGFTAILGQLISIPPVEVVFYRTLLAATGLFIILIWKKESLSVKWNEVIKLMGIGALIAVHWIFFFAAARVSTVSVCLAGMATTSLFTSFTEPIIFKRRVYFHEVFLGLVIIAGLYVIFHFEFDHALGLIYALLSAFLAALFSVLNAKVSHRHSHIYITFYEMVGAFFSILLFIPFYSIYFTDSGLQLVPENLDWLWLFLLAGVCTVYAYSQWVEIMKRLTAFATSLIINLEPVYGIVLALIIFGEKEKMDFGFYIGTAIILLSVFLYPVLNKIHRRKQPTPQELL
ncbi:MAG: EamA family transporter [Cyclobacteriaceae bacterium]|nr:EamA family transporter [Cyclobacteriaceae bacterium]